MNKSSFFTGQPIFNQILSLIPRSFVSKLVRQYDADRYCKRFHTYDHLVTMLYSTFHQCSSLREVITGMQASSHRLHHLGIRSTPRRSTLADANERRKADLFQDLYHLLYEQHMCSLPDSRKGRKLLEKLYVIDSSIIMLFSTIMKTSSTYTVQGRRKGGIKAHVLLRAKDNLPCFVRLTEGIVSDTSFLSKTDIPAGSIVVMDRGYRNFQQFIKWNEHKITWVTRLSKRNYFTEKAQKEVSKAAQSQGVISDTLIDLGSPQLTHKNPVQQARVVVFYDEEHKNQLEFMTNNLTLPAITIANIYKKRWQIELFFKRIKQNFQLHSFLGDNENAIRIQVWCALIADLLLKIIKDKVDKKRKWSMSNLASLIRLHLGTYINIRTFLINPEKSLLNYLPPQLSGQLRLFPT